MVELACAGASHIGGRERQEDSWEVRWLTGVPGNGALAVCLADGMGGHAGGDLASQAACGAFISHLSRDGLRGAQSLYDGLLAANDRLATLLASGEGLAGMGCTLVGALVEQTSLSWVSVGDSLLYLVRGADLYQINDDHSMASILQQMVENGEISAEEAASNPDRNALLSAVMGEDLSLIDLSQQPVELEPGDRLIFASDGIATLNDAEILEITMKAAAGEPGAIAERLVAEVIGRDAPHQDNVTVCVVETG